MNTMSLRIAHLGRAIHVYGLDATRWFATIDDSHMRIGDEDEKRMWTKQGEAKLAAFAFVNGLAEDEGIL
jgi:hypothetical protein